MDEVMNGVGNYFQLTNSRFSSPILDPTALEYLKTGDQTQLIIIDRNQETTIKAVKKLFPELSKVKMTTNKIYAFFDEKKRPVIILTASDKSNLDLLLKEMKTKKYFEPTKIVQN
jgi:nucleoid-associated protein YejK